MRLEKTHPEIEREVEPAVRERTTDDESSAYNHSTGAQAWFYDPDVDLDSIT